MGRPVERAAGTLPAPRGAPGDRGLTTAARPPRGLRLDWRPLMAVPKRKTSKSRRDKRRATHSIESVRVNLCPQCNSPKRPHHVCPTCGTYKGREVEALKLRAP